MSINQKLAYNGMQMWMHFHKAEKVTKEEEETNPESINYHADKWLEYLKGFLKAINYSGTNGLVRDWEKIINNHRKIPNNRLK